MKFIRKLLLSILLFSLHSTRPMSLYQKYGYELWPYMHYLRRQLRLEDASWSRYPIWRALYYELLKLRGQYDLYKQVTRERPESFKNF